MDEAASSILATSTCDNSLNGFTLAGVVAGEGSFFVTKKNPPFKDGSERLRFIFSVQMASRDRPLLEMLRMFLGRGSIQDTPPARYGWEPMSTFSISSNQAHHMTTIPFAEEYLLPCAKRRQFEEWRDRLYEHETAHPSRYGLGPSPCSVPGCGKPVRGRGLCRSHYYRATGY